MFLVWLLGLIMHCGLLGMCLYTLTQVGGACVGCPALRGQPRRAGHAVGRTDQQQREAGRRGRARHLVL